MASQNDNALDGDGAVPVDDVLAQTVVVVPSGDVTNRTVVGVPGPDASLVVSGSDVVLTAGVVQSLVQASPGSVRGNGSDVDSMAWQKAASLVEDGWTTVKGKKCKSSTPFDMNLRSHKDGQKWKS